MNDIMDLQSSDILFKRQNYRLLNPKARQSDNPDTKVAPFYRMSRWRHLVSHSDNEAAIDNYHDDVIKLKHFPRYWPFVR